VDCRVWWHRRSYFSGSIAIDAIGGVITIFRLLSWQSVSGRSPDLRYDLAHP
jgi:hypothetical protein